MNREYTARVIADLSDTETVLPAVIYAIANGDFEEAGKFMTEDVVLEIRGASRFNGSWSGRDEVVDAMRRNFGSVRDQRPVVECSASSGYTTALLLHEDGVYVQDEEPYSVRVTLWVTFESRLINRIEELVVAA